MPVAEKKQTERKEQKAVESEVNRLVENAKEALEQYMKLDEEAVDRIVKAMAEAAMESHMELAKAAVEETGRGVFEDKLIKNMFAAEYISHSLKDLKTVGIIAENEQEGTIEVAEPVGVVAGVTPVTNPTSTTVFKSLICAKTRNPIIFGFHPSAQKCSSMAAKILNDAAVKAGAPEHAVQWIEHPSIEATNALMNHPGVSLILATGGSSMVRSAYSAGKPALGVGPGNVPCYIDRTADVERACTDIMLSKTFDNGMICASEQAVVVDREVAEAFEKFMREGGCVILDEEETARLSDYAIDKKKGLVKSEIVGMSASKIARDAGINVADNTKILIAPLEDVGEAYPLSREKLSPILAYFIADSREEAFEICDRILELGGLGHTAVIHSRDDGALREFGRRMKVGRVIANSPSTHGAIGDIYNTNTPSLTLGCGSYGSNSTTSNVSSVNLINIKKLSQRKNNMQWFKVPPKIYFEEDSIRYLSKMPDISRAFIVTDRIMAQNGYVDKILYYLRKRKDYCHSEVFTDVEPDPDIECVMRGFEDMVRFKPDVIIALGGGSVIDAAKGMWLFYESPETAFEGLKLKFMDIRKRTVAFPHLSKKAQLVAVPTTSGTGSEVTGFTVITDRKKGNIKYPLADYELTPDVAIIDPQFVRTLPAGVAADTGMDVLTHAIEAYVSVMASDYTDALALGAIKLVFRYLPRSYHNGGEDREAREKMHNASAMAGMAFTNAFLGLNHSMAHKLGGEFHIPHGRANAVLLPHVIAYNADKPTKFVSFPKYERHIAHQKYAKIAEELGFKGADDNESVETLINEIKKLMEILHMPMSLHDCGIDEEEFLSKVDRLSYLAMEDQCTGANPRYPLVEEIKSLYLAAYYG